MSRLVKKPAALFSVIGVLILIPIFWRVVPSLAQGPQQGPAISATELQVALLRAGLSAETLTASGVSSQQVSTIVSNARAELVAHPTRITEDDATYATARASADALQRKIESGLATQQEIASFATATAALESAQNERQAALDAVFSAATISLNQSQITLLQTMQANHAWKLPTEFLTVERTETEWISLRDALSNERIAAKYGNEANGACQSLLATARANPTVAAAKANAVANLAMVSTTWNSASAGN
ncbi:MAG TPA: hypothetical protein VJO33_16405 [Gemmatimonadaceae bacterium]|nr:hypothetical protein [Gemmatimonadaceae bacterium]